MTKFTKLFAVAAFAASTTTAMAKPRTQANGRPAAGNTMTKGGGDDEAELEDDVIETPRTLTAFVEFVRHAIPELAIQPPVLAVSTPRVLASGKPACGNVGKKMPVTCIEPASQAQVAVRK